MNEKRDKRISKISIPIKTKFRFYKDSPKIDIVTEFTNISKDHRLRVGFNLPYRSDKTITSTHFGYVFRKATPEKCVECIERPSGIQAQKRFIRVEDLNGKSAITLFNKGLPEVELVDETFLALTLIRCVGTLSRSDFIERPIHAGPALDTPGAQELNTSYTCEYGFVIHPKDKPIQFSYDLSEAFALKTQSILLEKQQISPMIKEQIFQMDPSDVRISSIRMRENKPLITVFNTSREKVDAKIKTKLTSFWHFISSNMNNIT